MKDQGIPRPRKKRGGKYSGKQQTNTKAKKQKSPKKRKTPKGKCSVDELVEGDEKLGVPTVDPRQGKKFTRAGRKKTGRKAKPKSTKGRKPSRIESPEEEVDENLLFDIPEKAKILPSRAQMQARAEAGYGGENPDLPGDDEEDLPTDLLGEDEVLPMGSGAYPFLQEETHDDFVKRMVEHIDGPVPIWDVRITTKQGYDWVCGDVNSSNMPPIPVHPTFVPYGQPGPNIPGLERMENNVNVCTNRPRNKCIQG